MEIEIIEKYKAEADNLSAIAASIIVVDQNSYLSAGEFGKSLKLLRNKITDYFKPLKEAAHKAHKAITQKEAEELSPIDDADDIVRQAVTAYLNEQARLQRVEQARLDAEAKKAADAERERLLKQAVKADEKGNAEKAEALIEKAEQVYVEPVFALPTVAKTVKTTAGNMTAVKDIKVTVIDKKAFAAAIGAGLIPITCFEEKAGVLKSWVKSAGLKQIAGCRVEDILGVRL